MVMISLPITVKLLSDLKLTNIVWTCICVYNVSFCIKLPSWWSRWTWVF